MAVPTFVYKIIPSSSPLPAILPDILPPSDLDQKDGFIHLSTASQILGTLKLVFKDDTKVYVLKIEYSKVEKDVKWEEGSCVPGVTEGELFPHLYNELRLKREEIESIVEWERDDDNWDMVVNKAKEDCWLTL